MLTIRKATVTDCELIHKLAWQIFPETYKDILSPEQNKYMMEWMYSIENLRKQMEEEGHVYFIASHNDEACGYVSIQQQGKNLFHLQKIYVLPSFHKFSTIHIDSHSHSLNLSPKTGIFHPKIT